MSVEFTFNAGLVRSLVDGNKRQALQLASDAVLAESNARVPFREGDLKESGQTAVGDGEAAIGYASVYAARQHEEVGWSHPNGGQAKFLETALQDKAGEVGQIIATALGQGIGR